MTQKIYLLTVTICITLGGLLILEGLNRKKVLRNSGELKRKFKVLISMLGKGKKERYEAFLIILTIVLSINGLLTVRTDFESGLLTIILALCMYELFRPVDKLFGRKSPYIFLTEKAEKLRQQDYKQELFEITVQLKNLLISVGSKPIASQYIIEQLLPYTNLTKEYFAQLLSMNMKDETDRAADFFTKKFDMKLAGDFVYIVKRLDYMKPEDFMPMLDTLLENFEEEQETIQVKRQTRKENFLFLLASAEVIALIGNFVILIFINTISEINAL